MVFESVQSYGPSYQEAVEDLPARYDERCTTRTERDKHPNAFYFFKTCGSIQQGTYRSHVHSATRNNLRILRPFCYRLGTV